MENEPIVSVPVSHMVSDRYGVLVHPYALGQFRIQITDTTLPDAHAPEGHGQIVLQA